MPKTQVSLQIPVTSSPVPDFCSVHATNDRGHYGDSRFRGNCSGELIADLLEYFAPNGPVLDPMEGSGTCGDVCAALDLEYQGFDLARGFDATSTAHFGRVRPSSFVFLHPPYRAMIEYNDDERCLSRCRSLDQFLDCLYDVMSNCVDVLMPDGKIAVLIGDYTRNGHYEGLPFHTFNLATELGLRLACPEIIRLQHGANSTGKTYDSSFVPRLHDVCMVFKR